MSLARTFAFASWLSLALLGATASTPTAQATRLDLDSQPGDFAGAGLHQTFTPLDGTFNVSSTSSLVSVSFSSPTHFWLLQFASIAGQPLVPGVYTRAERYPLQARSAPGFSVLGDGRGCNVLAGRFVVLEMTRDLAGNVTSFAADLEQHCDGSEAALFASIRVNSSLPIEPRLAVGGVRVREGDDAFGDASFEVFLTRPAATAVTASYRSVAGSAQPNADYVPVRGTLSLAPGTLETSVLTLVVPNRTLGTNRTFQLHLANVSGVTAAFVDATAEILDDDDPLRTFVTLDSQASDFIGQSVRETIDSFDAGFSSTLAANGASVGVNAGGSLWSFHFAAPNGSPLVPGTYTGAERWGFQSAGAPGLDVSGAGRGCNTLTGSFVVREIVPGPGGTLARFAVDFEQHCGGASAALFGSVRFHSDVPIPQQTPVAGDFDASGTPDLVWRSQSTGFDLAQLLDGLVPLGFAALPRVTDPSWEIVGTNDWNGDGKSDVLWRNRTTGQVVVLFCNGVTPIGIALLPTIADTNWEIVGNGRFDSDALPDLLWRNRVTGENGIAFLNGTTSFQLLDPEPDPDWEIVGAADFNRDGWTDILWHNRTTFANRIWQQSGTLRLGTVPVVAAPPDWDISATGDFDHDGQADLVLRNATTGERVFWFMRDHRRTGLVLLDGLLDPDWQIVGPK